MPAPDVTLVSPYPAAGERHGGPSGVASYTANLAHALAAAGARVAVVAPAEPGEPARAQDGPVRVLRPFARGPRALPAALRAARATGARTVHLQHETFLYGGPASVPGLAPALAGLRRSDARSVVTMHHVVAGGTVDGGFTRLHRVAAPAAVARAGLAAVHGAIRRLADRVIVHEPAFAAALPGAAVVPHGVEEPATPSRPAARARLGLDPVRPTVLCFGFVAPYKGLEAALEAAALAGEDAVELVVAGGEHPRLAAAGDAYAQRLRAAHPHARFTGYVGDGDVADWFAAADLALFLYPRPVSASGGLALALAHGTPVLLSPELAATAAAPQALLGPREPRALARRLRELAADPAGLDALRDAAVELGRDRAWPAVARAHLEIYAGAR
jgi:glycosyltransferase involved in cell wall biosynthesis